MNEENFETGVEISQELQATIEKKVKELKAANPQLRVVFPIVVDGNDYDEKRCMLAISSSLHSRRSASTLRLLSPIRL